MNIKYILSIIILVVLSTGLIGCDLLKKRVEKSETTVYTLNGSGKNKIVIKNTSGDIKVSKSADTLKMVKITALKKGKVKPGDLDKPFEDIRIKIDSSGDEITVTTDIQSEKGLFKKNSSGRVDYDISIPQNIKVNIDNVNGQLTLTNLGNDVDAELVNGMINFESCSGNLNLSLTNGEVRANIDSTKGIKVDVTNGSVKIGRLKNVSADIYATTVYGKVKFDDLTLKNVSSDKKNFKGTIGDGKNNIRVSTVNGSITLSQSEVFTKFNKNSHRDDFEGFHFDFNDEDNENDHVKIDIDGNNINVQHSNDKGSETNDSLKNKTGKTDKTDKKDETTPKSK